MKGFIPIVALMILVGCRGHQSIDASQQYEIPIWVTSRTNDAPYEIMLNPMPQWQCDAVLGKAAKDYPTAPLKLVIIVQTNAETDMVMPLLRSARKHHITNIVVRLDQVGPRRARPGE